MDVLLLPDGARVGFPVVAAEEVALHHRQPDPDDRDEAPPPLPVGAADGRGGREPEGDGVEEVGEGDGGEGVEEVGEGLVGDAKGAMRHDVGTVGEVEEPCVQGRDLGPEDAVGLGEPRGSAGEIEAREEDIVGGLQARRRQGEDVFRGEVGKRGDEGDDGGEEEDGEGLGDGPGEWLHRGGGGDRLDLLGAIPGYELRDEEGAQSEEEGFEAVGMLVLTWLVGANFEARRYERVEGDHDTGEYLCQGWCY